MRLEMENRFKAALAGDRVQIGCWVSMGEAVAAEIAGTAGFDWLLIDGEHAPNDVRSIRDQLLAAARFDAHPIVRVPVGEPWIIKMVMDAGAQSVMVPMVESAEQARAMVRAMRYPPDGVRGVGATGARVSGFGSIKGYTEAANAQACLIVQVESRAGLAALDEILAVEGVDAVFIGPADLSADMGFLGRAEAPEVLAAIRDAFARIRAAGKGAGIISLDPARARTWIAEGSNFIAVAIDTVVLAQGLRGLASAFKG